MMTRRTMLWRLSLGAPLVLGNTSAQALVAALKVENSGLSRDHDAFLEELERATFRYFADCAQTKTGLVKDRSHITGEDNREIASIAAPKV